MSFSIYQSSIPVFNRMLDNLSAILKKAEEFAATNKVNPSELTEAKLAEDMFPLVRQVQIASDAAKGAGARLANIEIPSFPDDEKTFSDLQNRITKTKDFLKTIKADQIVGSEDREVSLKVRGEEMKFSGQDYLLGFALPNFFFHITATYAILRNKGVPLGKLDYLGGQ